MIVDDGSPSDGWMGCEEKKKKKKIGLAQCCWPGAVALDEEEDGPATMYQGQSLSQMEEGDEKQ